MMDSDWQVVSRGKNKKQHKNKSKINQQRCNADSKSSKDYLRQATPSNPEMEMLEANSGEFLRKLKETISSTKTSSFFIYLCEKVDRSFIATERKYFSACYCLGIGNFSISPSSYLQLVIFLCIIEKYLLKDSSNALPHSNEALEENFACNQAYIFDPILTSHEMDICKQFGMLHLEQNLHGMYKFPFQPALYSLEGDRICGRVLFFMPHCPFQLYCNLLWTNVSQLDRIAILGNRYPLRSISIAESH